MFLKNEIVYNEGAVDDKFYIIYNGAFKLQKLRAKDTTRADGANIEVGYTVLRLNKEDITGVESCKGEPYRLTLQVVYINKLG
jgi:hypothetical protein